MHSRSLLDRLRSRSGQNELIDTRLAAHQRNQPAPAEQHEDRERVADRPSDRQQDQRHVVPKVYAPSAGPLKRTISQKAAVRMIPVSTNLASDSSQGTVQHEKAAQLISPSPPQERP